MRDLKNFPINEYPKVIYYQSKMESLSEKEEKKLLKRYSDGMFEVYVNQNPTHDKDELRKLANTRAEKQVEALKNQEHTLKKIIAEDMNDEAIRRNEVESSQYFVQWYV